MRITPTKSRIFSTIVLLAVEDSQMKFMACFSFPSLDQNVLKRLLDRIASYLEKRSWPLIEP